MPEMFGKFELLEKLGEGASSVVYRARQPVEPSVVALKILKATLSYADSFLGRFGNEMKIASSLVHPGICRVYASGREGDRAYVVLELVGGKTLTEHIADAGKLSVPLMLKIGQRVSEALAYAHSNEIVHRDIKPDNIMVDTDGTVKILDFGLARRGSTSGRDTQVVGTPAYMPPEQARGEVVDHRADIYALGAVLYHALSGTSPYPGDDPLIVLRQVTLGKHPSIDILAPEVPASLRAVIKKAMAPLEERYLSAGAMLDDLKRCERGQAPTTATAGAGSSSLGIVVFVVLALLASLVLFFMHKGPH